jgi:multiple sugar transport system permease protein
VHEPRSFRIFRVVVVAVLGLFTAVPLYVMVTSSIKPLGDVQGDFTWWPTHPTLRPFIDMWSTVPLGQYFVNSLVVSVVSTVFSVLIAIFAAYAVSRYRFFGRRIFTGTVLATQMFPGILFLLPLFLIFVNIDKTFGFTLLYQTRVGLIVTYLTFSLPFSIWMLASYLEGIPRELDEAARVDGCRTLGTLFRVVLPAARPGVIAVAVYAFMTAWGEILFAS